MATLDEDFEYVLNAIEHSRLPRKKQLDFARLLLECYTTEVAPLAASIRSGSDDSLEIIALTALSVPRTDDPILAKEGFLTYEQRIIKDAADQVFQGK
jgi:hypothetical protein